MLAALGRGVYRRRWLVLALWVVAVAVGISLAPGLADQLKVGGFDDPDLPSARAAAFIERQFNSTPSSFLVVYRLTSAARDETSITDGAIQNAIIDSLAGLRGVPEVKEITSYATTRDPRLVSADRKVTFAVVGLSLDSEEAQNRMPQLRAKLAQPLGLEMWVTGSVPVYADINRVSQEDLVKAERVIFPLALIALVLIFRTLVAAAVPLVMAVATIMVTLGSLFGVAQVTDLSIFVLNVASVLGIGLAIDYSLLVVSRFREELARGEDVSTSLAITLATAGRAVVFSGLTVAVGLGGLLMFKFVSLRSMGIGGGLVVLASVLAALTFLPAVLGILGPRVNMLPVLPRRRASGNGFWHSLATQVMRRPWPVFVLLVLGLLFLGTPVLRIQLGAPDATMLPTRVESRQGYEVLQEAFGPGITTPVTLALEALPGTARSELIAELQRLTQALRQRPGVLRVESAFDVVQALPAEQRAAVLARPEALQQSPQLAPLAAFIGRLLTDDVALVNVYLAHPSASPEAQTFVKELRRESVTPGFRLHIAGLSPILVDIVASLYRDFPKVIALVVGAIYVALVLAFSSLVIPLKAVLMNTLSILASYGALVYVFQEGHFSDLLNFTSEGFVESTLPVLLFCILFGLSMDYEVFLLSRIKEAYDQTGDNTGSVALGLERTGAIITSAALILVLVSGSFALGDIIIIKAIGLGMALAIALDATLVRALLVPATMRLLGDLNWWAPAWLRRVVGNGSFLAERAEPVEVRG